jgi:hypothetical protein
MIHPLAEDYGSLKDAEVEERIQDLSRKYFQTQNPSVKQQISLFLDIYKTELRTRQAKQWEQQFQKRDKGLDKLINVS